ncbi:MAG: photosystem I assembly protein Ycf4 [Cyanobacteriota bacterium]|nr:photosystem I assembly protein Ycf4 [Cyanobacteriota bacterium]
MTSLSDPPASDQPSRLYYAVRGSRRTSVYFWAIALTGGSLGFTLAGISSYLGQNLLPFTETANLIFIPQGITMLFYGLAGSLAGLYQWLSLYWDLGGGYNQFDRVTGKVEILRRGFPGKDRQVKLVYDFADVQNVRVELKEGLNPKRAIYLRVKGRGDIPLTPVGQPAALADIENQAAEIARFLNVSLEGI